jgi:AraC-like DNA-binding protein
MSDAPLGSVSLLLLGMCFGAMLAMAAAMLRAPRPATRWIGVAFYLSSGLFAFKLWEDSTGILPNEIAFVIAMLANSAVGWFWLLTIALFEDAKRLRPAMYAAPALLALFALLAYIAGSPGNQIIGTMSSFAHAGLAIHAVSIVLRSWKDDLVESRRRLRGPFVIAVALYILSLSGFDLWDRVGELPAWYPMLNAAMFAAVALGGALVFLDPRSDIFGAAEPEQARAAHPAPASAAKMPAAQLAGTDRATQADLDRLDRVMKIDMVWREEGLTIASLAVRVNMPEAQLRRLINDQLGYRNFPSFVNGHRIRAAKDRLADPHEARTSISAIAFEIGFASLGPFNRAFKEETGQSPSEWRRQALNQPVAVSKAG